MKYQTLDAIGDALIDATSSETDAMFEQGRIILSAVAEGFDVDAITRHCAGLVRRTHRTLYKRYAVARTFKEPHPELTYEFHSLCAALVDYRQSDEKAIAEQQKQAQAWLDRAASENYSTRTLRAAIQAAGGKLDEKPFILLDGAMAYLSSARDGYIELYLDDKKVILPERIEVQITLVKAPSVEAAVSKP